MERRSTVGKRSVDNGLGSAGLGYLVIPSNTESEQYKRHCFKNKTICIKTEDFEFLKDVPIGENELQKLKFPTDERMNGSVVGWVKMAKTSQPVVFAVFGLKNDGNETESDHVFHLLKTLQGKIISVKGDAEQGALTLGVQGDEFTPSKLAIRVTSQKDKPDNTMDVYVQGDLNVKAEKDLVLEAENSFTLIIRDRTKGKKQTVVSYKLGEGLSVNDEFGNDVQITKDGVDVQTKRMKVRTNNASTQPVALANETIDDFKVVCSIFEEIVKQAAPLLPNLSAALTPKIVQLRTKLNKLKAKTLETD